ncbi:MAG: hypothetical protein EPO13_08575 [Actinomycetota bacterium]|nr:MAG: hypothetical protein EPO13_08575 [Actinomycetota bacterium]
MQTEPVEVLVVSFPGTQADERISAALHSVIGRRDVRLVDLAVVHREADGTATVLEADAVPAALGFTATPSAPDQPPSGRPEFDQPEPDQPITAEDVAGIVAGLQPGHSAAIMVVEHLWTRALHRLVAAAGGTVALHTHVHPDAVETAISGG